MELINFFFRPDEFSKNVAKQQIFGVNKFLFVPKMFHLQPGNEETMKLLVCVLRLVRPNNFCAGTKPNLGNIYPEYRLYHCEIIRIKALKYVPLLSLVHYHVKLRFIDR